jgi:arginyl-tRNA synthetase
LQVTFDRWQRESDLYKTKLDKKVIEHLRRHDLIVEKDGALWFRTTAYGDDKDRVLIKKDGEATYFLSDIALRWYRFGLRKVARELLFLGADHHGYVPRIKAAMAALGFANQLDVHVVQLVKLLRGGQEVKMSKRAGTYVAIEEVIDEVGLDVARFFFLMHGAGTHMDFNLDAAKEKSEKNPVFYVQYAHARIASLLKKVGTSPTKAETEPIQPSELQLVKLLLEYPRLIEEVAMSGETQKLPFYAMELARGFHDFYTQCRVIDEGRVWARRLVLVKATKKILAEVLSDMGIQAPAKM